MKRLAGAALIIVAALTVFAACGGDAEAPAVVTQRTSPPIPPPKPVAEETVVKPTPSGGIEVLVDLKDNAGPGPFLFAPDDFEFNRGDVVNFKLESEAVFHTFTVEGLGIDEAVNTGEVVDFTFTFDEAGTYTIICIPHEALGMVATITVSEAPASQAPAPIAPAPPAAATELAVDMTDNGGLGPFEFDPVDFSFNTGETVNFTFTAESQLHTFTVADLDIDESVNGGEVADFSFTFDKPGTCDLICIPHQALGMVGTITVQ